MSFTTEEFEAKIVGSTIIFGLGTCIILFSLFFGIFGNNLSYFERTILIGGALFVMFYIIRSGLEFRNFYSKKIVLGDKGITSITFKKNKEFLEWSSLKEIIVAKPGGGMSTAIKIASMDKNIYIVSFHFPDEFGFIKDCLKERAEQLKIQFLENIKVKSKFAF